MKRDFCRKAPLLRLVFAIAALSVTISIGGLIDFLATDYVAVVADTLYGRVQVAEERAAK